MTEMEKTALKIHCIQAIDALAGIRHMAKVAGIKGDALREFLSQQLAEHTGVSSRKSNENATWRLYDAVLMVPSPKSITRQDQSTSVPIVGL